MDIGTGIALAGIWVFAAITMTSKNLSQWGSWLGIIIASILTAILI